MHTLIIEDSKVISKAIKLILEQGGISAIECDNGQEAKKLVKEQSIQLVILDLNMPGVSGETVFKQLKADPETKNVKILILTAKADALKWNDELKGCDAFMAKPFDNDALVQQAKKLLHKP